MESNNNNNVPKTEAPKPTQTNSTPNPVAPKQENNPKILKQMGLTSNDLGNEPVKVKGEGNPKILNQMGLKENEVKKHFSEPRQSTGEYRNYDSRTMLLDKDGNPVVHFKDVGLQKTYEPAQSNGINGGYPAEWNEKSGDIDIDAGDLYDVLKPFLNKEENEKYEDMLMANKFDPEFISDLMDKHLDNGLNQYYNNNKDHRTFFNDMFDAQHPDND